MSIQVKRRPGEMPGYDVASRGSYIPFGEDGGEAVVEFDWDGNDEMELTSGDGWAELQNDGSLKGEIHLQQGDEIPFITRRETISSTAC